MRLPVFLSPIPTDKTKRDDNIKDEDKADPVAPPPMTPDSDLGTGPPTSHNKKSSGMQTTSSWTARLTILSCKAGGYCGRIRFGKKQIHTDVLPSLNSVAEGLSDILENCDVSTCP